MSPLVGDLPLMLVPLGDGPLDAASRDASRLRVSEPTTARSSRAVSSDVARLSRLPEFRG